MALFAAPDPKRWEGRRDKAMIALAVQTGLRVSELTSLNCADISLGDGAAVRCEGKERKQRTVPLGGPVQALLQSWAHERTGRTGDASAATPSHNASTPRPRPPSTAARRCVCRRSWNYVIETPSNGGTTRSLTGEIT
jgi:site-specific recombinase XerC